MTMFEPLEEQQQWQVEVGLGSLINALHVTRERTAELEQRAKRESEREAELLAEISSHRKRLGITDGPISKLLPEAGDDREPLGWPGDGASGFRPFESPQAEE